MKKIFKLTGFFVVLALAGIAHAQEGTAVITQASPEAQIIRQGQPLKAEAGMSCQKEDILRVPGGCTLDLALNNMAGCRVLENSVVTLADASPGSTSIKINNGNAIFNLKKLKKDSAFRVETPTAVAAVRGTQFWGRVDQARPENPVTTFAVREGEVEVLAKTAGKSFNVKKGQALDIPIDGSVVPSIRPALDAELQAMEQATSIKTSA